MTQVRTLFRKKWEENSWKISKITLKVFNLKTPNNHPNIPNSMNGSPASIIYVANLN